MMVGTANDRNSLSLVLSNRTTALTSPSPRHLHQVVSGYAPAAVAVGDAVRHRKASLNDPIAQRAIVLGIGLETSELVQYARQVGGVRRGPIVAFHPRGFGA